MPDRYKHFSLLWTFVDYGRKKFYNIGPWSATAPWSTTWTSPRVMRPARAGRESAWTRALCYKTFLDTFNSLLMAFVLIQSYELFMMFYASYFELRNSIKTAKKCYFYKISCVLQILPKYAKFLLYKDFKNIKLVLVTLHFLFYS